ncbi:DEP domain-containing protein 1A [Megalops cyprinoides]|uniref:DEP domain-containing protein 1A n=1 Tax=Megalops cyprinoides TaxID=118141 RepID=UPI001864AC89|nr:DEP domain-containing protein 1A [Megalops cyprinoides]
MDYPESHIVTPGPYRATKLWNEVTKLFRAGMPLKKHRQHFRLYGNCFTAAAAVDWLHDLLRNNSNFGPEVTRQQTVQLLKKFLKNHVIEDVKGRWGSEDLDDNSQLYRFPSTSPLKPIPSCPPLGRKRSSSLKEREGLFKIRTSKKFDKETQENVDPLNQEKLADSAPAEEVHRRELTEEDILDVWRSITLTHLERTLGLTTLEDVLDPTQVNSQHIVYNMTNVNKHGVVTLQDKTDDLPHWVLSAMKCLANWPKYDSNQPSYPGFERDVFKTVSDYFLSLPQPLLTFEYYELFVNILVLCGYIVVPKTQRGKRKSQEEPSCPQPPKTPNLNDANLFKSTECLLLSLIRKQSFEETESPMREVFSFMAQSGPLEADCAGKTQQHDAAGRRLGARSAIGGSCQNLFQTAAGGAVSVSLRPRSCSLEGSADDLAYACPPRTLFQSSEQLMTHRSSSSSSRIGTSLQYKAGSLLDVHPKAEQQGFAYVASLSCGTGSSREDPEVSSVHSASSSGTPSPQEVLLAKRLQASQSRSVGICAGIGNRRELSSSCFSINAPVAEITMKPDFSSSIGLRRPSIPNLTGSSTDVRAGPVVSRRCYSSVDLSNKPAASPPSVSTFARQPSPDQSLLQPQLERVAIEALQLCTLLLPPASRRKLQLLMRMISRMSQNVDMPRLHDAIGTRTLMVHTFSRCVLCCEEEVDLDELLATRLVSFLMDHHQDILKVPVYLQNAVQDHIAYLKKVQITYPSAGIGTTLPTYSFCRQISPQEFEQQKLSVSQAAIADLLENLIKDKTLSVKEKKKRLKQFQKQYPDIYHHRFPTTESEAQLFVDKPKIKPPMLISMKKTKAFSIRN